MKTSRWICVPILANFVFSTADASLIITTDTVQNGGILTINPADELVIHGASNPLLTMTNGATSSGVRAFLVGTADAGNGRLRIEGGSKLETTSNLGIVGTYGGVQANGRDGYIGFNQNSIGSAVVTGLNSILRTSGALSIGYYGEGSLAIEELGFVESSYGNVGFTPGSVGAVTLGPGLINGPTRWNVVELNIGHRGQGTLNIGSYTEVSCTIGWVGRNEGSDGSVIVSGEEALWTASMVVLVGAGGQGRVVIENGGYANITDGLSLGIGSAGQGEVIVDGSNSVWDLTGEAKVGSQGIGILRIRNSGRFHTLSNLTLGTQSTGNGSLTLNGNGSSLDVDGTLSIGEVGHGLFTVEGGAVAHSYQGLISPSTGSNGSAMVDGTDSVWNIDTSLSIGADGGVGSLLIRNQGTVSTSDATLLGENAMLTIDNARIVDESGADAERITGHGILTVRNQANIGFESIRVDQVAVSTNAKLHISAGDGDLGTSRVEKLFLTDNGHFDLTDHGLIIADMTESEIRTYLKSGYNNGAWDGGNGIGSTLANQNGRGVGYAVSNQLGSPDLFMGMEVISTDILLRHTLLGDIDLDGAVNFNDLLRVAQNYGTTDGGTWFLGDFNYDDQIDFSDLLAVAQNYGMSALSDGTITIDQSLQSRFQSDWQLALASVPEPSTLALLAATPLLAARRKR